MPKCLNLKSYWSLLPLITSITTVLGFILTYNLAKSNCHIQDFWVPYISQTGTYYPENMVFSLIVNWFSFSLAVITVLNWYLMRALGMIRKRSYSDLDSYSEKAEIKEKRENSENTSSTNSTHSGKFKRNGTRYFLRKFF